MRFVAAILSMALLAGSTFAQGVPTVPPAGPNVNNAAQDAAEHARREAHIRRIAEELAQVLPPVPAPPPERRDKHHRQAPQNRGQGRWIYLPDIGWVYRPHVQPPFLPPALPASERDPLWQQYLEWQRRFHERQQPWLPVPPLPGRRNSPFLPNMPLPDFNPTVPLGPAPIPVPAPEMPPARD